MHAPRADAAGPRGAGRRGGAPARHRRRAAARTLDEQALRVQRARHRGHPGAAVLTRLVGLLADRTESDLEDASLALVRAARLPAPEVNVRWDAAGRWVRTDFRWPQRLIVVEVDGWETHRGRAAAEDDADRAASLRLAGWALARFTHRQVHGEPRRVVAVVDAVLTRASARA
jgi:very-short-patch-repair endonuclease